MSYKVQLRMKDSQNMVEASPARFRTYQSAQLYAVDRYMEDLDIVAWLVSETKDEVYP